MDINGKVAVVSGGASGMGLEVVRRLVTLGARCAIFDINEEAGAKVAAELGDSVVFSRVDVTSEDSVKNGVSEAVSAFGTIHICVNFAGILAGAKTLGREGPFPLELWNRTLAINLTGTFNVLRLCASQMAMNDPVDNDGCRGVVVNTASTAAFDGQIGQAAYSASKAGIVGMTLPIARDLAAVGIRVNAIAPGLIDTPMFESLPEAVYESLCRTPLFPRRLGRPAEIAHIVTSIIENDYLNGECIRMDAGLRMPPK